MLTENKIYVHPYFGEMYYIISKPENFVPGKTPMIVFLHGAGERGKNYDKICVHGLAKSIRNGLNVPALVVSPQCDNSDIWPQKTEFLKAFIDFILDNYDVDRSKISITGLSMGGYGTWDMIMTYPGFFYKAAPVCGGGTSWRASNIKIPVWAFHGDADKTVPIVNSIEMVDAVNASGGNARLTIFHGVGHNSWDEAYNDTRMIEWLTE